MTSAIVNLGGNVYAMGSKGGNDWTIGLQDPFKRGHPIAAVKLQNKSVVTSGIYERFLKRKTERSIITYWIPKQAIPSITG